jgi:hypothetical protein
LCYCGFNSGHTPWATPQALFCDDGFFWDRVSQTIFQGWLWSAILLITASWVPRITGVSHRCQAPMGIFNVGIFLPMPSACWCFDALCFSTHPLRRLYSQTLQIENVGLQTLCGYRTSDREQAFLLQSKGSSYIWDTSATLSGVRVQSHVRVGEQPRSLWLGAGSWLALRNAWVWSSHTQQWVTAHEWPIVPLPGSVQSWALLIPIISKWKPGVRSFSVLSEQDSRSCQSPRAPLLWRRVRYPCYNNSPKVVPVHNGVEN